MVSGVRCVNSEGFCCFDNVDGFYESQEQFGFYYDGSRKGRQTAFKRMMDLFDNTERGHVYYNGFYHNLRNRTEFQYDAEDGFRTGMADKPSFSYDETITLKYLSFIK